MMDDYSTFEAAQRTRVARLTKLMELDAPRMILRNEMVHLAVRECGGRWRLIRRLLSDMRQEYQRELWWFWHTKIRGRSMEEMDALIDRKCQ